MDGYSVAHSGMFIKPFFKFICTQVSGLHSGQIVRFELTPHNPKRELEMGLPLRITFLLWSFALGRLRWGTVALVLCALGALGLWGRTDIIY